MLAFDDDEIDKKTKEVNSAIKIFQETKTLSGDAFEDPESIFTEKNKLKNNNNNKPKLGGFKKISHKQTDSKVFSLFKFQEE